MNVGERGGTGATKLTTKLTDCVDVRAVRCEVTDPHRRAHKTLRMRKSIEKPQRTSPERRTGETADATGAAHSLGAHFDAPWSGSGRPAHAPAAPRPAKHTVTDRARPAQIHVCRQRARRVTSTHATLRGSTTQTHPPRSALRAADRRRVHIRGHLPP